MKGDEGRTPACDNDGHLYFPRGGTAADYTTCPWQHRCSSTQARQAPASCDCAHARLGLVEVCEVHISLALVSVHQREGQQGEVLPSNSRETTIKHKHKCAHWAMVLFAQARVHRNDKHCHTMLPFRRCALEFIFRPLVPVLGLPPLCSPFLYFQMMMGIGVPGTTSSELGLFHSKHCQRKELTCKATNNLNTSTDKFTAAGSRARGSTRRSPPACSRRAQGTAQWRTPATATCPTQARTPRPRSGTTSASCPSCTRPGIASSSPSPQCLRW